MVRKKILQGQGKFRKLYLELGEIVILKEDQDNFNHNTAALRLTGVANR